MSEKTYYPIFGGRSKLHIIGFGKKTMLCGSSPGFFWEMAYGKECYPEIKGHQIDKYAKIDDFKNGLLVANEHAPKYYFCEKCYNKYLEITKSIVSL